MFATHFAYIEELQRQNSREWFHAHKDLYDQLRKELIDLSHDLIIFLSTYIVLGEINPRKCVFRINRDMRFVSDDRLYKNNM